MNDEVELFTWLAAGPSRWAPVRSRSLMVVTVTVWLGWSYCTDSVVLVITSSRSSSAASERWDKMGGGEKMSTDSQVLPISKMMFALNSPRASVLSFSNFMYSLCLWKQTAKHMRMCSHSSRCVDPKQILTPHSCTLHLLLLWLWSVLPWFSSEFPPRLLFSFPPFAYGNRLNTPWEGRRGRSLRNQSFSSFCMFVQHEGHM